MSLFGPHPIDCDGHAARVRRGARAEGLVEGLVDQELELVDDGARRRARRRGARAEGLVDDGARRRARRRGARAEGLVDQELELVEGLVDQELELVEIGFQPETDRWARAIVQDAWQLEHPGTTPTLSELQGVQAIGRMEGAYGLATRPAAWKGSNNWGAVQCTHGEPCGENCFSTRDTHADGSPYVWCYRKYATPTLGAKDVVRLLTTKRPAVWAAMRAGDAVAMVHAMHESGYYELDPNVYTERLARNAREISEALGEPLALSTAPTTHEPSVSDPSASLFLLGAALLLLRHLP